MLFWFSPSCKFSFRYSFTVRSFCVSCGEVYFNFFDPHSDLEVWEISSFSTRTVFWSRSELISATEFYWMLISMLLFIANLVGSKELKDPLRCFWKPVLPWKYSLLTLTRRSLIEPFLSIFLLILPEDCELWIDLFSLSEMSLRLRRSSKFSSEF